MDYTCRNTIIQTMLDFGCEKEIIDAYMECFDRHDGVGQKKILEQYRARLLDELHVKQKEIDLLDYMVYQMGKCDCM